MQQRGAQALNTSEPGLIVIVSFNVSIAGSHRIDMGAEHRQMHRRALALQQDNFVYPMGYWTDLLYGEQFAKHNTNSVDHSLKLSKSFMISPYREP